MKKQILIYIAIGICLQMISACSTTQKLTVSGIPGTEIYSTEDGKCLGTISETGTARIELSDDNYYAFLLSKSPGSNEYIPFALDYRTNKHSGTYFQYLAGLSLASIGGAIALMGGIGAIVGDEIMAAWFSGIGGGAVLLGVALGIPANFRADQLTYEYSIGYLKQQHTNQDIRFMKPVLLTDESSEIAAAPKDEHKDSSPTDYEAASVRVKPVAEKSSKSLNDYGKKLEGTYVGTGTLSHNKEVLEKYNNIKIVLTRISKDEVGVDVVEANGEKFFAAQSQYGIKAEGNNKFTLTNKNIEAATITIDANKKMLYLHPRVNIDGDIYVLTINAAMQ